MVKAEDIRRAKKILGLGESATLKEIKKAYRNLVKKYHPDVELEKDIKVEKEGKIREINWAYGVIMKYIEDYRYPFTPKEIKKQMGEETLWNNYAKDWMWGRGEEVENESEG